MNLIIFYTWVIVTLISTVTNRARIPSLPNMERRTHIPIRMNIMRIRIGIRRTSAKLYKLLAPIQKNSNAKNTKGICSFYMTRKNRSQHKVKNIQRAYMPPNKFDSFLQFSKRWLYGFHSSFLPLYNQHSISLIKNALYPTIANNKICTLVFKNRISLFKRINS